MLWVWLATLLLPPAQALVQVPFNAAPPPPDPRLHTFSLKHALHLSPPHRNLPLLHRTFSTSPLLAASLLAPQAGLSLRHTPARAHRPSSPHAFQSARRASFYTPLARKHGRELTDGERADESAAEGLEWQEEEVRTPDVRDVATLRGLAVLANNAYTLPDDGVWWDMEGRWNVSDSFGWLEDGIRGHVFADETNSTVVIAMKGSSVPFVGGSGSSTSKNDKRNDNLLFSCCCARVGWSWSTVCDCYQNTNTCSQDCIEEAVMADDTYYTLAIDLYNNITALYPHAQIWLTGHSLGGSLATLLSLTFGAPAVAFQSPADLLAARRLHLPLPPGVSWTDSNITTHVFHTADPIAMGTCNGVSSSCALAGFAFESRCHVGRSIIYDSVGRLGWGVDVRTHSIQRVIESLLVEEWGVSKKGGGGGEEEGEKDRQHGGRGVPDSIVEEDCVECFRWDFVE